MKNSPKLDAARLYSQGMTSEELEKIIKVVQEYANNIVKYGVLLSALPRGRAIIAAGINSAIVSLDMIMPGFKESIIEGLKIEPGSLLKDALVFTEELKNIEKQPKQ